MGKEVHRDVEGGISGGAEDGSHLLMLRCDG